MKQKYETVKCTRCKAPHRIPSNIHHATPVACECGQVFYPGSN